MSDAMNLADNPKWGSLQVPGDEATTLFCQFWTKILTRILQLTKDYHLERQHVCPRLSPLVQLCTVLDPKTDG